MLDPKCDGNSHFSDLKDTYNLSNLVKSATCFKSSKDTLLDVLLTNKQKSFQKTFVCETQLSDCRKLVENKFCHDLDQILIKGDLYKTKDPYNKLTKILYNTIEKHAPLKSKTVRGNQARFMNKELRKAIMEKSQTSK